MDVLLYHFFSQRHTSNALHRYAQQKGYFWKSSIKLFTWFTDLVELVTMRTFRSEAALTIIEIITDTTLEPGSNEWHELTTGTTGER